MPGVACPMCSRLVELTSAGRPLRCPDDGTEIDIDARCGTQVDGYTLGEILARGRSGTVYHATHAEHGDVAFKIFEQGAAGAPARRTHFFEEMQAVAEIDHPNIVRIFAVARPAAPECYLAMELLRGVPLAGVIRREAPFTESRAIGLAMQIGEALGRLHDIGVVHGALDPTNLFVCRSSSSSETSQDFTAGEVVKVSGFEPSDGESSDVRADVQSLGMVLYEMLTGRAPHVRSAAPREKRLPLDEPRPPRAFRRDLTPELDALVLRCTKTDPAARYSSMSEVGRELRALAMARTSATVAPPGPKRGARVGVLLVGAALVTGAATFFFRGPSASRERTVMPPPTAGSFVLPPRRGADAVVSTSATSERSPGDASPE